MKFDRAQHNQKLMFKKNTKFDLIELIYLIFFVVVIAFAGFSVAILEIGKEKKWEQAIKELKTLNSNLDLAIHGAGLVPAKCESEVR